MKKTSSIETIKSELIKSCINYDTKSFIPFLMSDNVITEMPNKMRFYRFFKKMVNCTKQSSERPLSTKIENEVTNINQRIYNLNFYDKIHKYSRLSFEITESKESIYLDILPF